MPPEIVVTLRAQNEASKAIQQTRTELDALARAEKARPVGTQRIPVDTTQVISAQGRIAELEKTLQSWQRVSARGGTLTVGDLSQIKAAESELKRLQASMTSLAGKTTVKTTVAADTTQVVSAKGRIAELEKTLQSWQRVSARGGTITAGDLSQIKAAEGELKRLQAGMSSLTGKTAVKVPITADTTQLVAARDRITELEKTMASWQRVAARGGTITAGDLSQIKAAEGELKRLQTGMASLTGKTAVKVPVTADTQAARAGLKGVSSDLASIDRAAGAAAGGLAGLASAAGAAGIATLVAAAVRGAAELGALGERVKRSGQYFTAFSGGASLAAQNLSAMQRATNGALSETEAMNAASKLQSMGLAENTAALERQAHMAVILGGNSRSAAESLDEWSLMLANQSVERLDTFGISSGRVRQRIDELTKTTPGLTREQAFLNATLEIGAQKVAQLEAAGVTAGTTTDRLAATTKNLKDELALLTAKPYTVVVEVATSVVSDVNKVIAGVKPETRAQFPVENAQRGSLAIETELNAVRAKRNELEASYNAYLAAGGNPNDQWASGQLAEYDATIAKLTSDLAAANVELGVAKSKLDTSGSSMLVLGNNAAYAVAQLKNVAGAMSGIQTPVGALTSNAWYNGGSNEFYGAMNQAKLDDDKRRGDEAKSRRDELKRANTEAANDWAQKVKTANEAAASNLKSKVTEAINSGTSTTKGLFDVTTFASGGNALAPGSPDNPFEAFNRLAAVAKDSQEAWARGMGSPLDEQAKQWSAMYGKTPEQAVSLVGNFERGNWTPEVQSLIDQPKLKAYVESQLAQGINMDAFVANLAKSIGVKGLSAEQLSAMLGIAPTGKGPAAAPGTATGPAAAATPDISPQLQSIAGAISQTGTTAHTDLLAVKTAIDAVAAKLPAQPVTPAASPAPVAGAPITTLAPAAPVVNVAPPTWAGPAINVAPVTPTVNVAAAAPMVNVAPAPVVTPLTPAAPVTPTANVAAPVTLSAPDLTPQLQSIAGSISQVGAIAHADLLAVKTAIDTAAARLPTVQPATPAPAAGPALAPGAPVVNVAPVAPTVSVAAPAPVVPAVNVAATAALDGTVVDRLVVALNLLRAKLDGVPGLGNGPARTTAAPVVPTVNVTAPAQGSAPGAAGGTVNHITLTVQPGAVVVKSDSPNEVAGKVVDVIFSKLEAAAGRIGMPAGALAPGAR
jgi:ribosomal 50S subunit-associated protein YjgA (DUF615 family)